MIDIIVPVLNRPQNAQPLVDSIRANTELEHTIVFVVSYEDKDEQQAIVDAGIDDYLVTWWPPGPGDAAKKWNLGYEQTEANPFVFMAADDIEFTPGWDVEALKLAERFGMVGTNDDANPTVKRGKHSTHTLFSRAYIDSVGGTFFDGPGVVYHEGYDHQWCNPGTAPVWMADLTFRPLGSIVPGDRVMGWTRPDGLFKRLCPSEVFSVQRRQADLVRVDMESGRTLWCTPDHLWVNGLFHPSGTKRGIAEFCPATPSRTLLHVAEEPEPIPLELHRLAGWVAGIYDGEGSGVYAFMQSARKNPAIIEEALRAFELLKIPYFYEERGGHAEMVTFMLTGGRRSYLDFLLKVQPVKREKLTKKIMGRSRFGQRDRVVSVTPDGSDEVFSMTTETGNYVAWGYASKNCDTEAVRAAMDRGEWAFARKSVVRHHHPFYDKTVRMDSTYEKALGDASHDSRLFKERVGAWTRQRRTTVL